MSSELLRQITLLEARLSLLERRFGRDQGARAGADEVSQPALEKIFYAVDQPGLIIADAYEIECDLSGRLFCWTSGAERVQFVFPHAADRPQICCMRLAPHPLVDFGRLCVMVNDEGQKHVLTQVPEDLLQLKFPVDNVGAPNVNVILRNLRGVRPSQTGENDDDRLLTARFYGAEFSEA